LIERGERVLRVHSTLTAASRREGRGRGKSDSIDALAVARAALREGLDRLPAAHLDGPELDLRLLVDHRERLVRQRVAINNRLQWHVPDPWPETQFPGRALFHGKWGPRIARRLARAASARPRRRPPDQRHDPPHRRHPAALPPRGPGLHQPQTRRRQEHQGRHPLPQTSPHPTHLAPPPNTRANPDQTHTPSLS
jgi:hypothetical protein